jgi:uncharacterized membrane-anchored protein
MRPTLAALCVCLAFILAVASPVRADEAPPVSPDAPPEKPEYHWIDTPGIVDLGHDISLTLPERHAYLNGPEAAKLLAKNGSFHNDNLVGLVVGKAEGSTWFVTIRYDEEGYVKDTDPIDSAELLKAMKDGTEEANEERKQRGFPAFHVTGWSEEPYYEKSVHHLVWALLVHGEKVDSVNFNTRVLGRRGVVSLDLVCDPGDLTADKPEVADLLAGTAFKPGARYEDFEVKHDKVAQYGLAGLVLGGVGLGAAKLIKIGLIAKFWNVILAALLALKKAIVIVVLAVVAFFKRLFGGKKAKPASPQAATEPASPPAEPPPAA